jgi:ribose transport system permease protein
MTVLGEIARRNASVIIAWGIALALFAIATAISPQFASLPHMRTILITASFIGFVGLGQTLCILTGGIDLSMPSVLAGSAVLTAYLSEGTFAGFLHTVPFVLALALVAGLVNGIAIAYARVPPIIMTLGMNGALQGLLLVYTNGGVAAQPPQVLADFVSGSFLGLSPVLLTWVIAAAAMTVFLGWSTVGRKLYAVGTNDVAARLAGIAAQRLLVLPYVISSLSAAITGWLVLGFLGQAFVNMGDEYLFSSAIAVAIGGASILGGRGNYVGTIAGAIVLALVAAILPMFSLGTAALKVSYGAILLATVILGRHDRGRF